MSRKVSVELELEAAQYLAGVRSMMAETKAAAHEVDKLGNQIDGTARSVDELAVVIIAGKKEMEGFGTESKELGLDLTLLDERIDATKRKVALLGLEFAATGDAAAGKRFGDQRSMLGKLEALRKELESGSSSPERRIFDLLTNEAAPAGTRAGNSFMTQFSSAIDGTPVKGVLIAGLVGIVAAALPAIGAMVAGAVTGVVGVGGIAGGIFAASKDQDVRDAAARFSKSVSSTFFGSGSSFVEPVVQSLDILAKDFAGLDLGKSFAIIAPYVTEVAHGIGDMAKEFMPGFNRALVAAGPILSVFAQDLPVIGKELGDMFATMAESKGAAQGMRLTLATIGGILTATGNIIGWLSDRFENMTAAIAKTARVGQEIFGLVGLGGVFKAVADRVDFLRQASQLSAGSFGDMGQAIYNTIDPTARAERALASMTKAIQDAQTAISEYIKDTLDMSDANLAVAQDFLDLSNKFKAGRKNWTPDTQAGIDNLKLINQTISDMERARQKAIDMSDGSQAAIDGINKKFNDQITLLETAAIKAGDTKAAFEAMAGTYRITIITDVLTGAAAARASKTDKDTKFTGRASGGPLDAYVPYVFGEHGPEIGMFAQPGQMWSNSQSNALAQQWSTAPGSQAPIVVQNQITLMDPMTGAKTRAILITESTSRGVASDVAAGAYP